MALFGPQFVQALGAAMGGQQQAANLFQQNQQIASNALALKQAQASQAGGQAVAKAIQELLAQSPQAPTTQPPTQTQTAPVAPQQGQVGSPGLAAPGAGPGVAQAGTPASAQAGAAPAPAVQTPQATVAPSGTQALDAAFKNIMDSPFSMSGQLSPYNILKQVQQDNPNLDPGTLSAIVNDYIMPQMTAQQQAGYKQFQELFQLDKLGLTEQDKSNMLAFQIQKLDEQLQSKDLDRNLRAMLSEQRMGLSQELAALRVPLIQAETKLAQDRDRDIREHTAQLGKVAKLPPQMQARLAALEKKAGFINSQITSSENAGDTERIAALQPQLDQTQNEINDLLDQADQLEAGGAATQPPNSQGSGKSVLSSVDQTPVDPDSPPKGVTPEQWKTQTPRQKVLLRKYFDSTDAGEQAKLKKQYDALPESKPATKPIGQ